MDQIVDILQPSHMILTVWLACLWAAATFLIALGFAIFFRRKSAIKFLEGYASSTAVNTVEALLRVLAGLAFVGASAETKYPIVFFAFGMMMVVTAIPILLFPKLHRRFAIWAIPFAIRILPLYGTVSVLIGGFLIYSIL